ncbi:MAG TPA: hypothetical protein VH206_13965 [Xanthobacteraceae bacterium]|jgi:hypothetical protein|nr:hypothetical protein [Xanthobacteraceae bacterium]
MKRRDFMMLSASAAASMLFEPPAARAQYTTDARNQRAFDKLKRGFGQITKPSERARMAYVSNLIPLRDKAAKTKSDLWQTIDAEVKAHPAPTNSDSKALSALLAGQWTSPRHDYLYRADGTWTMLPADPGATNGTWRIEGNQYYDSGSLDPSQTSQYTIVLITKRDFVFFNDKGVFYETRIK